MYETAIVGIDTTLFVCENGVKTKLVSVGVYRR